MANDLIVAVATPPGKGGIGVVRLSGPGLTSVVSGLTGNHTIEARQVRLAAFRDAGGGLIDRGLMIFFSGPHSYTGDDVLELHGHGNSIVLQLLISRCVELGARLAEPGEFTKRAFLNGKIDLAQAESVADLIEASTAEAARSALRSLEGDFSRRIDSMTQALTELRVQVESSLDFPEEDLDFSAQTSVVDRLKDVQAQLNNVLSGSRQGALLKNGAQVILFGEPNVGKSSLMNCLAGNDLAIVTEIPGTTRDMVRETISLEGIPVCLIDTAGLREAQDKVEAIGITRSLDALRKADLALIVDDASRPATVEQMATITAYVPEGVPRIVVENKIDLAGSRVRGNEKKLQVSAKTGAGMDQLRAAIIGALGWSGNGEEGVYLARERHLEALVSAKTSLVDSYQNLNSPEILAEDLARAHRALSSITGEMTADDLLGEIFSRFCIGK